MESELASNSYIRAGFERVAIGALRGIRPEPSLDQSRRELSSDLSEFVQKMLGRKYGPLVQSVSEEAIINSLRAFESKLIMGKAEVTIILEELADRLSMINHKIKR